MLVSDTQPIKVTKSLASIPGSVRAVSKQTYEFHSHLPVLPHTTTPTHPILQEAIYSINACILQHNATAGIPIENYSALMKALFLQGWITKS